MRSNPAHRLFFIFELENILRSNLNFSIWLNVLYGLEKNFSEIFTYRRGAFVPQCLGSVEFAYVT